MKFKMIGGSLLMLIAASACAFVNVSVQEDAALGPLRCDPGFLSVELTGEKQLKSSYCWVASARSILRFHGKDDLSQCELISLARGYKIKDLNLQDECCSEGDPIATLTPLNHATFVNECRSGGWPHEVFREFNLLADIIAPPAALGWNALRHQVCENGPFVFAVQWNGGGYHTGVVRGYHTTSLEGYTRWVDLDGHDGRGFYVVPYELFVRDPTEYTHYTDFINIRPGP